MVVVGCLVVLGNGDQWIIRMGGIRFVYEVILFKDLVLIICVGLVVMLVCFVWYCEGFVYVGVCVVID